MLLPNAVHHALLRLQTAVLRNHIVHVAEGLPCPICKAEIRGCDTEETNDGCRIVCHDCHRDILVVEESH
jgi:hypothetical protein